MATTGRSEIDRPSAEEVLARINENGTADLILICEHASNTIPAELDGLGLSEETRLSHAAWDPGALGVAVALSEMFDAPLIASRVSRLVYDCNRPPEAPSAMPERSEIHVIPGNAGLTEADRRARAERYYFPFRDAVAAAIARKLATGRPPALVTIHSFTPVFHGVHRSVEVGILHDSDARLADRLLDAAAADGALRVARNEPYGPADGVTHTLLVHALPHRLENAMIEFRNDLIATPDAQRAMARRFAGWLRAALPGLAEAASDARADAGRAG